MKEQEPKNFKYPKYLAGAELIGSEGFPKIRPTQSIPENVISFGEHSSCRNLEGHWLDHFVDDYKFNGVYVNCDKYLGVYSRVKGIIGTDYSAYRDMSPFMRKANVGRNRIIDYYLQSKGIDVIPVISFAYMSDFAWCLDGLPQNSSVAISTNGSMRNLVSYYTFIDGVYEIQKRLKPSHLIIAGGPVPELDAKYDNIIYYPNFSQRWAARRKKNG